MTLTKERKGEIALTLLKHVISEKGLRLRPGQAIKDIKEEAKKLNIPEDEAIQFAEELIREIVNEIYGAFLKK